MNIDESELLEKSSSGSLSIGTVSKLTGISVHTLRAWEKRYSVVEVNRSSTGRRMYSASDVMRLRLLRKLTQAGHSIGNVANLSDIQLESMHDLGAENRAEPGKTQINLCLYSDTPLGSLVVSEKVKQNLNIVMQTTEVSSLQEKLNDKETYAAVMVFNTIMKQQMRTLRQSIETVPRHKYFVVFNFAQREMINELKALGFYLIRAPITFDQLFGKVLDSYRNIGLWKNGSGQKDVAHTEIPEHKFTKRQLDKMASISSSIECECPKHITSVIHSLTVFEGYSQNCSSRNEDDAFIHNEIYKLTAQARELMERAITLVIEEENIDLSQVHS